MNDTSELVNGLKAGKPAAQQRLWQTYWDKVYPICFRILQNRPDAVDAAADLLTDFTARHVQDLAEPEAIWRYLRLMAVRRSMELRKKRNRFVFLDYEVADFTGKSPEGEALLTDLRPLLNHCLGRLTQRARECLRLKYQNELSNERIGDRTGVSKQYVGRLISQSLETLRTCLEKNVPARILHQGKVAGSAAQIKLNIETETIAALLSLCSESETPEDEKADTSITSTTRGTTTSGNRRRRLARVVKIALPVAAAVLLLFGVTRLFGPERTETTRAVSILSVKGEGDRFIVAVARGAARFVAEPLTRIETDDRLGMFYTTTRGGYLMVLSRDRSGKVLLLHPSGSEMSAPIVVGENISLKEGAIAEPGSGCEWIVAVFSDAPLIFKEAAEAVESGRPSDRECGLDIQIAGARRIDILPLRR